MINLEVDGCSTWCNGYLLIISISHAVVRRELCIHVCICSHNSLSHFYLLVTLNFTHAFEYIYMQIHPLHHVTTMKLYTNEMQLYYSRVVYIYNIYVYIEQVPCRHGYIMYTQGQPLFEVGMYRVFLLILYKASPMSSV